ncbi:MAG TPA: hypothetical protein VGR79_05425 [Stellaceae bacterium]|nr:hypothetical protein [Stellaceae bacterium]
MRSFLITPDDVQYITANRAIPPSFQAKTQALAQTCRSVTPPVPTPNEIALLRLDTDWHKSSAHELAHLFPRLACQPERYLLQRVDYTGRLLIKA